MYVCMIFRVDRYQVIKKAISYELANFIFNYFLLKRDAVQYMYKNNAIVIDYGGKPVGKIRDALKGFPYQANLCAAIINHANSVGKKLQDDIKQIIQKI